MNSILLPLTQAASVSSEDGTWFNNTVIQEFLGTSIFETLAMTFVSGTLTIVFGLLLGLTLVTTGQRGQAAMSAGMSSLGQRVFHKTHMRLRAFGHGKIRLRPNPPAEFGKQGVEFTQFSGVAAGQYQFFHETSLSTA